MRARAPDVLKQVWPLRLALGRQKDPELTASEEEDANRHPKHWIYPKNLLEGSGDLVSRL